MGVPGIFNSFSLVFPIILRVSVFVSLYFSGFKFIPLAVSRKPLSGATHGPTSTYLYAANL